MKAKRKGNDMKHILIREDEQQKINQLPTIKKRLEENNYVSVAGRKIEQEFYDSVSAMLSICEWADEHFEQAQEVLGTDGKKRVIKGIKLPYYDEDAKKVVSVLGNVTMWRVKTNYVESWRNHEYHWIYPSVDFRGRRLDWQEELFADILLHQDNFEEWCERYTESLRLTEYPYKIK